MQDKNIFRAMTEACLPRIGHFGYLAAFFNPAV